jgi:hypothetical protein
MGALVRRSQTPQGMRSHRFLPDEPILPSHVHYPWYQWIFLVLSALVNVAGMLVTAIVDLVHGVSKEEPAGGDECAP